jgi:hypothetical protein
MSCSVVNPDAFPIKSFSYFGRGPMANRMMFVVEALAVCHAGRVKRVCIDQNNSGLSPQCPLVSYCPGFASGGLEGEGCCEAKRDK